MSRPQTLFRWCAERISVVILSALLVCCTTGCVGTLVNLIHAAHGNLVPAKYTGLKEKRVAVVCVSNSESFGPTSASHALAREVGKLLNRNISDVELVEPQEIASWIDNNNWDYVDYQAVGKGVNADMVLAIDLDSFNLYEGKTLFKGRADVKVVVYDISEDNREVFSHLPNQIQFPANAGYHTTDMSEGAFRRKFVNVIARKIARQFYAYDVKEDFANDATIIQAGP